MNDNFPTIDTRIETAIQALKDGKMVVVSDDEDRENEGDLIMAASKATPESIAFMIHHTSGILCTPLTGELADRFELEPMVKHNTAPLSTPFTVSIDYLPNLTTGISAAERCATVRALADPKAKASDFVKPGHIFPLRAREGGVLFRSGHTEAAVDLMQLSGLPDVGVIAELVNQDGTVKTGEQVTEFAKEHDLPFLTIDDLIKYLERRKKLVNQISEDTVDTPLGTAKIYSFNTVYDDFKHVALLFGDPTNVDYVPTYIHRENLIADIFWNNSVLGNLKEPLEQTGCALCLYLRSGGAGVSEKKSQAPEEEASASMLKRQQIWKELGLGAQILNAINIRKIDLIKSEPKKYVGLGGFGIELKDN